MRRSYFQTITLLHHPPKAFSIHEKTTSMSALPSISLRIPCLAYKSIRGEVFHTWNSIVVGGKKTRGKIYTWSDGSRYLLSEGIDELGIISANSDFIAFALGVEKVEAYGAGEGENVGGKARISFPLEPGISFL